MAANYPFATIEPNTGIVPVPDTRLQVLADMYHTQKIIPATVTFVDIAGLVAGASNGEGLGNKFLANIRETDAIVHVVRAFSGEVVHVADEVNPKADIDVINTELILADIQSIQNHLPKVQKDAKFDKLAAQKVTILQKLLDSLDKGIVPQPSNTERELIDLPLLTLKPVIYLFNVDEATLTDKIRQAELASLVSPAPVVFVNAKLEEELKDLGADDATELLSSYGIHESGLSQLARTAYDTLGLQSYLTAGEKEVRAWTIHQGDTAPQAAGVIHTDFEKGFIAAAIVDYDDLVTLGSESAAKNAGKLRTEGRDYIMRPGDVVEFRFNVSK